MGEYWLCSPDTEGQGRKVGFLAFFSSKRPADVSDLGTALFQATGAFSSQWPFFFFFLIPVQKLPDDKPHPFPRPQPQGIVLGSSQLGSFVSTCTFKKI